MSKYGKEDILRLAEEEDVEFIRLQFTDIFGMLKNVAVTFSQLKKALEKLGGSEMGAAGEAFNPELHNAVSHIDDENAAENVVAQVYQKGYKIGDKVVRHATVVVAN